MHKLTQYKGHNMQRLRLINSFLSCATTWKGVTLYGVPRYDGTRLTGYWIYFPHAVGDKQKDGACKAIWYHNVSRVRTLEPLLSSEKERYTLVPSLVFQEALVWAKVVPVQGITCNGCAFESKPCAHITPPCTTKYRHDDQEVIFVTAVEKW